MMRPALIFILAIGFALSAAAQNKEAGLPENTIDCKQFKKTGPEEWIEVETAVFDLGKIRDINLTNQPVKPRSFKFGGTDLYPVLEGKCGAPLYFDQAKLDQSKGDYDSALTNLDRVILLNPNYAEAYDSRGEIYANKGDYRRAIADYDEALRLDQKLESATNHRTIAAERLAKEPGLDVPAGTNVKLEAAVAAPEKVAEPNGRALASAKIPEQTNKDQDGSVAKDTNATSKSQPESGASRESQGQKSKQRRRNSAKRGRRFYDGLLHMLHVRGY